MLHLPGPFLSELPTTLPTAGGDPVTATVDQVLSPYIYVFYAAFLVAFAFTPVMRQVALYYGIVDHPDHNRKFHAKPIAYLGGAAMFLGWVAGLAISQFTSVHRMESRLPHIHLPFPVVMSAAMIALLGLCDDVKRVRARYKILVQVLAAGLLLLGGVGVHSVEPLLGPVLHRTQVYLGWDPGWIHPLITLAGGGLTVAVVVGCCNASNLLDGMDGLCGGVTAIIAAGFTFLSVHMATHGSIATTNLDGMRVVLGLALLGSVLGFLLFNFSPASIFMGDTGSLFLGFSSATLILTMAENSSRWFLASMIMFALPWLDTALAFARRYLNGRPLFSPDRHHVHHQIQHRGYSVTQTVLIVYAITLAFVLLGAVIVFIRVRYAVAVYIVVFGGILVTAVKAGLVHERLRVANPSRLGDGGPSVARNVDAGYDDGAVLEVDAPTIGPTTESRQFTADRQS
jgi:UDP-GlcNAc:undecaprenyl-phosphate GlcNAc-1-phosphate transferase